MALQVAAHCGDECGASLLFHCLTSWQAVSVAREQYKSIRAARECAVQIAAATGQLRAATDEQVQALMGYTLPEDRDQSPFNPPPLPPPPSPVRRSLMSGLNWGPSYVDHLSRRLRRRYFYCLKSTTRPFDDGRLFSGLLPTTALSQDTPYRRRAERELPASGTNGLGTAGSGVWPDLEPAVLDGELRQRAEAVASCDCERHSQDRQRT